MTPLEVHTQNISHTRREQAHSSSQRQHWRRQRRAHQHITKRSPGHKDTSAPSADIAGGSELQFRSTSAPNGTPQTCQQTRGLHDTSGEGHTLATCAPVGGQQAAHCMAARPPPPGGTDRVWVGASPRPSTPSCAQGQHLRHEVPSQSPASSSPAGGVEYLHAHIIWACKYSTPAAGDEDGEP